MREPTRDEALAALTPTTAADLVRIEQARIVVAQLHAAGRTMREVIDLAGMDELALIVHELHRLDASDPAAADDVRDRCYLRLLNLSEPQREAAGGSAWEQGYDMDDPRDRATARVLRRFEREVQAADTPEALRSAADRAMADLADVRHKDSLGDHPEGQPAERPQQEKTDD